MSDLIIRLRVPETVDAKLVDPEVIAEMMVDTYNEDIRYHSVHEDRPGPVEMISSEWAGVNTMAREEARRLRRVLHNHPRSEYVRMARGNAEFVISALLGESS